jgi:hypothetical protein
MHLDPRANENQRDNLLLAVEYWNEDGNSKAPFLEDGTGAAMDFDGERPELSDVRRGRIRFDAPAEVLYLHPSTEHLSDLEIRAEIDHALGSWTIMPDHQDFERWVEPQDPSGE